jgi:arylsulfatase A-like enzyme
MLKTKNFMLRRDHYFNSTKAYVVFIAIAAVGLFFISTISTNFYKQGWTNPLQAPFSTTSRNSKKNDVILIVLDAVNAKSLSLYGGPAHTPNIEKLAQDSLTFNNCIASSSWTLPSHASLFSGYYPSEHLCILKNTKLNDRFDTLAEIFSANGYQTAALGANFGWLNERFNLNQGFQVYDVSGNIGSISRLPFHPLLQTFSYATNIYPKSMLNYKVAEDMVDESIHQLETLSESPFFFFLNLFDAHSPYRPPYTFASTYTNKKLSSLYRFKQLMKYFSGSHTKSSWDSYLLSQYYGEITYLDSKLGKLFDYLKSKNLYDSTLIVITADHGELFGKNGFYEHNNCPMYEGLVKIPLIVKTPFSKMVGIDNNTINLTDVFSTVLHLSNLPIPQGSSGEPFGGKSSGVAEFLTLGNSSIGNHRVIYDGDYKAFKYSKPASWTKESAPRESELYHLTKDPGEQENLFKKDKATFAQTATNLNLWTTRHQRKFEIGHMQKEPLSDKLKENLRSLGYLQ